jgi:type I restriction enzyme R subunit
MKKYNVPFVFSTNGHLFTEYGEDTGQIIENRPMLKFPTPVDLKVRYETLKGIKLDIEASKALFMPYKGGEAARWYFQDAAIRATLEKLARGGNRALLSLATGTGKTDLIALYLKRLFEAGRAERVLFLVDREQLAKQAKETFDDYLRDWPSVILYGGKRSLEGQIVIGTLDTIAGQLGPGGFGHAYFDLVVTDECHRSIYHLWRQVLEYFDAYIIGLTATPSKQTIGFFKNNLVT